MLFTPSFIGIAIKEIKSFFTGTIRPLTIAFQKG